MASILFQKALADAQNTTSAKFGDDQIKDFLRDKAMMAVSRNVNVNRLANSKKAQKNYVTVPTPGKLMLYFYDAKHKATLPYWDKFPAVFPLEFYKDGFLGINLHYLPPMHRARLMDALYDTLNNDKYDKTSKLQISYQILKNTAKMKYFKPCIKRYLYSHVQSNFIEVDITEWDYVLFLPLARFQKATQTKVWTDSLSKIRT
jgi:hypothetical protein